ncbi:DUF1642 domain-containing protein [Lactiplantibacillus plantarum]|uniref:DUF1642 domain-containing protein n=1 Tax=Lactiplantibacillus plantarum TaxID=1590 RepID=UPI0021A30EFE|nr:DUF1642 domain-containing protein [Lactiplantibacillus plantarum]MCT3227004.1 DUF1642 domain-containing protein [Lactiplantibacillus plantarum]MCT3274374.1 DUF1642 domain-containing protein [Lactiplantibacillus plantarum]
MIKVYRKTATIKAEQFDGSNEMVDKYELIDAGTMLGTHHSPELYLAGSGKINVGDWIATGVNGERWLIKNDIFKQTYAELPVIPKNVAERIITGHSLNDLIPTCGGIYRAMIQTVVYGYQKGDIGDWIVNHSDVFARAWLDGYVVEKEK